MRRGRDRHLNIVMGVLFLVALLSSSVWMIWRVASQWVATGVINWVFVIAAVVPLLVLWRFSSKHYVVEFACSREPNVGEPTLLVRQRSLILMPRDLTIPASAITWIEIRELAQKGRALFLIIHSTTHAPLVLGFEPFHERRLANLRHLVAAMRRVLAVQARTPEYEATTIQ